MSKVGRSDALPPRIEHLDSAQPRPVRTAAGGSGAAEAPNKRTRQLLEHSAPGAGGALGAGATVRNAMLRDWGKEPKEAIDKAVVEACPRLDQRVVSELTAVGLFGPLARTVEAFDRGKWAMGPVPVVKHWLRAFEAAKRVMRNHPAQRAVDLETWGARFHAARTEAQALTAHIRATQLDCDLDSSSNRAAFERRHGEAGNAAECPIRGQAGAPAPSHPARGHGAG